MSDDIQKKFEEMFGGNTEGNTEGSAEDTLETLKKMVQQDDQQREAKMIGDITRSMLEGFNAMLIQITFDILLASMDEEQRNTIRNQIYSAWKSQVESELSQNNADDSGLSALLGADNVMQRAFDEADSNIREYLKLDEEN